jgi:hypothetical protein
MAMQCSQPARYSAGPVTGPPPPASYCPGGGGPPVHATRLPKVSARTIALSGVGGWLLAALLVAGCGYEFGTGAKPGAARGLRLAVPVFHNDTFEPVLDKRVTEMVRRQFLQADGLTLVNDVGAAPLALVGHINGYGNGTIAFHSSGSGTNENRVTITASVQLQDTATKKIVWAESYTRTAEFFLSADLAINRSRQDRAPEEAAQAIAEDIVSRVLEVYSSGELK